MQRPMTCEQTTCVEDQPLVRKWKPAAVSEVRVGQISCKGLGSGGGRTRPVRVACHTAICANGTTVAQFKRLDIWVRVQMSAHTRCVSSWISRRTKPARSRRSFDAVSRYPAGGETKRRPICRVHTHRFILLSYPYRGMIVRRYHPCMSNSAVPVRVWVAAGSNALAGEA